MQHGVDALTGEPMWVQRSGRNCLQQPNWRPVNAIRWHWPLQRNGTCDADCSTSGGRQRHDERHAVNPRPPRTDDSVSCDNWESSSMAGPRRQRRRMPNWRHCVFAHMAGSCNSGRPS